MISLVKKFTNEPQNKDLGENKKDGEKTLVQTKPTKFPR